VIDHPDLAGGDVRGHADWKDVGATELLGRTHAEEFELQSRERVTALWSVELRVGALCAIVGQTMLT